jgi:hypothetical protein
MTDVRFGLEGAGNGNRRFLRLGVRKVRERLAQDDKNLGHRQDDRVWAVDGMTKFARGWVGREFLRGGRGVRNWRV